MAEIYRKSITHSLLGEVLEGLAIIGTLPLFLGMLPGGEIHVETDRRTNLCNFHDAKNSTVL